MLIRQYETVIYYPENIRDRFMDDGVPYAAECNGWCASPIPVVYSDGLVGIGTQSFKGFLIFRKNFYSQNIEMFAAGLKRDADVLLTQEEMIPFETLKSHMPVFWWTSEDWEAIDKLMREGLRPHPATTTEYIPGPDDDEIPYNFDEIMVRIIRTIEFDHLDAEEKAHLRYMDYRDPQCGAFWKLMNHHGLPANWNVEKWGLIIYGIALMSQGNKQAHNLYRSVGQTLYQGKNRQNSNPLYRPERLKSLLSSNGEALHRNLLRLFHLLANDGASFNWKEMAWFILNDNHNQEVADNSRRSIANNYYRAARYSAS